MFSIIVRKVLDMGGSFLFPPRTTDSDAPPKTRQRTRSRTRSLKGMATCRPHPLLVTVTTSASHNLSAAAVIQNKDATIVPVFVATHTTTEDEGLVSGNSLETSAPADALSLYASERVSETDQHASDPFEAQMNLPGQVWCIDGNDAHAKIPQKRNETECTANLMSDETIEFLTSLYNDPATVVWESNSPGVPHIALTPADESWDDFTARCSNQPNPHPVSPWLHAPQAISALSPFGPTEPVRSIRKCESGPPPGVFSPAKFAKSVSRFLKLDPAQALLEHRDVYKAQAYLAAHSACQRRNYYDSTIALEELEKLYVYRWTDPAELLLQMWRDCFMLTIHESEHPWYGVPHIVINGTLPNAPWDTEPAVVPEQDACGLIVPQWAYIQVIMQAQSETEDDQWYTEADEVEPVNNYYVASWSESEDESDEARTPSPPSRSRATRLEGVFEEDEDELREVPSVTETRFRMTWLEEEDDEPTYITPMSAAPHARSSRLSFSSTLPCIGETTREDDYCPLPANYKPLWTNNARLPTTSADDEAHTESGDDQSVYMDALDHISDADQSEDERGSRARAVPRPSFPRGKANIPAGKVDWFDLPEDDLGSLDFDT
ncbi:hypothetical protein C8R43DRAFT_398559 [Mycena crocata]|nr:hypothetical protein C8R43DRAFT_398559 [Mycena crocata]